ncbi:MAG: S9 family peptidase, partial [Nannocystaceae bacterium]
GLPFREGKSYFWSYNNGLQNQSVIHTATELAGESRVLLDPNTLSDDGTVALSGLSVSPNGKLLAYGIQRAGSDWQEYRVRDVKTGNDREDLIEWIKFSTVSWTKDNKGFYYARYDAPKEGDALEQANYFHKLYYHKLGTTQDQDQLVYERKDKKRWGFDNYVTDDGRFLMIRVWEGTSQKNGVFFQPLKGKSEVVELLAQFDAEYDFVTNKGPVMYFRTDLEAPRGKMIAIDTRKPERENWKTIIPEAPETLRSVSYVGGKFVGKYLKDAHSQIRVYTRDGKPEREVELPGIGTAYGFGGKDKDKETFYFHTGYATPGTIYRYDIASGKSEVFRAPKVKFNPDDYVTTQVKYKSKDGTEVPMFISHKKGLERTGQNPTYLYGYGGFNIAITPGFSPPNLAWMEMGGILAVANLRGGGEYGAQ